MNAGAEGNIAAISATRAARVRRIWLCADDYGISPAVNGAIRDLIVHGRLNATSIMVVAPSFNRSEALSLPILNIGAKRVAIGLHLTLTAPFRPLSGNFKPLVDGAFPPLKNMLRRALMRRLDKKAIRSEIDAQLKAFQATFGYPPDFVDGHQHVHLFPQIRDAVLAAVKDAAPHAWVRQCGRVTPLRKRLFDCKGLFLDRLSRRFRQLAARLDITTNPAFAGTYDFRSRISFAKRFSHFFDHIPDGGLVMCHPGHVDDELKRLDPLTTRREEEYAFFSGEGFPRLLDMKGVMLATVPQPVAERAG